MSHSLINLSYNKMYPIIDSALCLIMLFTLILDLKVFAKYHTCKSKVSAIISICLVMDLVVRLA